MIPDLRFVIGAVLATALLGVTIFGLAAAMHLSYQSKLNPLESSRLLAYSPDGRSLINGPTARFDNPFSNIAGDPNPVLLRQAGHAPMSVQEPAKPAEAPPHIAAATTERPADEDESAALPSPDDHDQVDERAVVDPPLPLDQVPASAAEADTPAESASDAPVAEPAAAAIAQPPDTSDTPVVPIETTPTAPAAAVENPPVPETTTPTTTTPTTTTPASTTPDVEQVGTIPIGEPTAARTGRPATVDVPALAEKPAAKRVKRKLLRKAAAKPRRPAAVRRAATATQLNPLPSNGFPQFTPLPNATRPAKGFWPPD